MKDKILRWYCYHLWTKQMVKNAVQKNVITANDYLEITGEEYIAEVGE